MTRIDMFVNMGAGICNSYVFSPEPRLGKMMVLGFVLGVGDALTTMAANSTTFPEIFVVEGRRRLSNHQRALAGDRASDHVAMLNAFQVKQSFVDYWVL